jgi:hypothetical protein
MNFGEALNIQFITSLTTLSRIRSELNNELIYFIKATLTFGVYAYDIIIS